MKSFDILIVNQGIAGLALACGLSDYFSIVIIENNTMDSNLFKIDQWYEKKCLINITSARILQYLKIWNKNIELSSSFLYKLEIFRNNSVKKIIFNSGYLGYLELGYVFDKKLIYRALINRARKLRNIKFVDANILNTINYYEDTAMITLNNHCTFKTKLVIGADGINSWVRKNANISLVFRDTKYYRFTNIIYTEKKHNNSLRIIINDNGLLVLLPLKNAHLSVVFWLLPPHTAKNYLHISTFTQSINNDLTKICSLLVGNCMMHINSNNNEISMLRMCYAHNFVNNRLVLLGTAAYSICPLFFKNINLELADAAVLLNHLKQLKESNKDIGYYDSLKFYEYNRKYRMAKNFINIPHIHMLLHSKNDFVKYAQYIIFYLINTVPNFKIRVLHHIMGLDDMPEWLLEHPYD